MMPQLLLHLAGDYVLQSHWMALNKAKSTFACLFHVTCYSLPFLLLKPSWIAFAVIFVTHFLIDRFALAKYLVWLKNKCLNPTWGLHEEIVRYDAQQCSDSAKLIAEFDSVKWGNCKDTGGYPKETPPFLWVWLTIAADNWMHLTLNWLALTYL